ncbi:hypothetical protein [Bartonella apis]|uniref:hypothetical protein n=1 Tax=Bartonella apis TaxID=1686310 RepID=UPI003BB48C7C
MINTSYSAYGINQFSTQNTTTTSSPKGSDSATSVAAEKLKPARINVTDDAESFKGLSRSQLAEIMANKDGLYTEDQQDTAEFFIYEMGMDEYTRVYKATGSHRAGFEALIKFEDQAGPLEKQTFQWAKRRANAVVIYENYARSDGVIAKDYDIGNSLYKKLKAFYIRMSNESSIAFLAGREMPDLYGDPEYKKIKSDFYEENRTAFKFTV